MIALAPPKHPLLVVTPIRTGHTLIGYANYLPNPHNRIIPNPRGAEPRSEFYLSSPTAPALRFVRSFSTVRTMFSENGTSIFW